MKLTFLLEKYNVKILIIMIEYVLQLGKKIMFNSSTFFYRYNSLNKYHGKRD